METARPGDGASAFEFVGSSLTGEVSLAEICDAVRSTSKVEEKTMICEFTASATHVLTTVSNFISDFRGRLADFRFVSDIRKILKYSIVGAIRHPIRRSTHTGKCVQGDLIISLRDYFWSAGVGYRPWEHFCTYGSCFVVETTEGLSRTVKRKRTGVTAPALGGLVRTGDETMYESDHTRQKSIVSTNGEITEQKCSSCGALVLAEVILGPSERRTVPCGCAGGAR